MLAPENDTIGLSRGAVICSKEKSFLSFFDPKNLPLLSGCFKSQLISLSMNIHTMKLFVNFCDKCLIFGLRNAFDVLPPVSRKLQKQTEEFIDLLKTDILSTPRRPPIFKKIGPFLPKQIVNFFQVIKSDLQKKLSKKRKGFPLVSLMISLQYKL